MMKKLSFMKTLLIVTLAGMICSPCFLPAQAVAAQHPSLTIACAPDNDLVVALQAGGWNPKRYDAPVQAVSAAKPDSAVLILADEYPDRTVQLSPDLFQQVAAKNLRLYVEFPSEVPGLSFASTRKTAWERFVVSSDQLGQKLPKGRLLVAHECMVLPTSVENPLLVVARVAGYDHAIFGIPDSASPLLFTRENGRILVATTKLSNFSTGRFAPSREWHALWCFILTYLTNADVTSLNWQPRLRPMYGPKDKLPDNAEQTALHAAAQWCFDSKLLVSESRSELVKQLLSSGTESYDVLPSDIPIGDGRFGILEGYASNILSDGNQRQRIVLRADCQAESAMVLALDWNINRSQRSRQTASNLLDYVYYNSDLCAGPCGNPVHPAYGLIRWGSTAPSWRIATYGDDNARTMLATMLAAACLDSDQWDEPLLRALLANLRTTGKLGFRGDRIDMPDLERNGWKHYHDAETVNNCPHFEAYNWACFLWAYRHTGRQEFLDKTKNAIRMTMQAFPDQWRWNDNTERARMLLPLAWLVRVDEDPESRKWLRLIVEEFLAIQDDTGALPERFRGGNTPSHYQIPASNEAYGQTETPLLQENGDPVSDQLYLSGFALLGLHEAAAVLDDPRIKDAQDRLAQYLCRIQIHSTDLPYLHGAWFRAFDFQRWEPWASSGDAGWGAWSVEAGWAQAWTAAVLGLRHKNTTLWQLTEQTNIAQGLSRVQKQMTRNSGEPYTQHPR